MQAGLVRCQVRYRRRTAGRGLDSKFFEMLAAVMHARVGNVATSVIDEEQTHSEFLNQKNCQTQKRFNHAPALKPERPTQTEPVYASHTDC